MIVNVYDSYSENKIHRAPSSHKYYFFSFSFSFFGDKKLRFTKTSATIKYRQKPSSTLSIINRSSLSVTDNTVLHGNQHTHSSN